MSNTGRRREHNEMERIADIEGLPAIGRYYLVPCIFAKVRNSRRRFWVPVIGPRHKDIEHLDIHLTHYHFDARFVGPAIIDRLLAYYDCGGAAQVLIHGQFWEPADGEPVEKVRQCKRQMPDFPLQVLKEYAPSLAKWAEMESGFKDKEILCGRCPHRGLPLNGLPQDEQGNVVCPGHGLRFNLNTGRLVSRLTNGREHNEMPAARTGAGALRARR